MLVTRSTSGTRTLRRTRRSWRQFNAGLGERPMADSKIFRVKYKEQREVDVEADNLDHAAKKVLQNDFDDFESFGGEKDISAVDELPKYTPPRENPNKVGSPDPEYNNRLGKGADETDFSDPLEDDDDGYF